MTNEQFGILLSAVGNQLSEQIKALDITLTGFDTRRHSEVWDVETDKRLDIKFESAEDVSKNDRFEFRPTGEIKSLDGLRNLLAWIRAMERRLI